jgi:2'-5' RNA ligase
VEDDRSDSRGDVSSIVSIELLLDPESEARVRADWQHLADAGLSSLAAHRADSNRPHVTLLVRPALAAVAFTTALAQLPVPVSLIEPVVFAHGDRGVLAWRVLPSDGLRDLHRAIHAEAPPGDDAAHTLPGEWTPHVTLARRVRLESLSDALGVIGPPLTGTGVSLRRWDSASATVSALR